MRILFASFNSEIENYFKNLTRYLFSFAFVGIIKMELAKILIN